MATRPINVLALAASSTKVGHVFLIDGVPYDWRSSRDPSNTPAEAYRYAVKKISNYRPELIVAEFMTDESKTGRYSRSLINQSMKAAQDDDNIGHLLPGSRPTQTNTRKQNH